jgi:FMN phosphatase YigB (HAD superfamily)
MANIDAILLDLDDTLLGNDMDVFLRGYFPLLGAYAEPVIDGDKFLPELLLATQAVINNTDHQISNSDVFWNIFCTRNGLDRDEVEPFFAEFYRSQFGQLRKSVTRRPEAAEVVRWCMDQGLKVVVATNPLFPLDAIEQRLEWAGVPVDVFDFDLVTGYENMHSAKPQAAYYREILTEIDVDAERALMVGDDWHNDVVPASQLGLYTFWITDSESSVPDETVLPDGRGTLADLYHRLKDGWLVGKYERS